MDGGKKRDRRMASTLLGGGDRQRPGAVEPLKAQSGAEWACGSLWNFLRKLILRFKIQEQFSASFDADFGNITEFFKSPLCLLLNL
jgi:hypothetical protein